MEEYGTTKYYIEQMKERMVDKLIYRNAIENLAKKEIVDHKFIEKIAEKITQANQNIKFYSKQITNNIRAEMKKSIEEELKKQEDK